ncbi:hypothetical protein [Algoriphagus marincola]|uniref:hypothetical protein n=1 Tax=Algoriphagus marincola TaxID=264027 RepID=UPI000415DED0|nr:hypothetical protein [Algoriphagus marincola]
MNQKIIRILGEYGQNLAASPNEFAQANVIALVMSGVQHPDSNQEQGRKTSHCHHGVSTTPRGINYRFFLLKRRSFRLIF